MNQELQDFARGQLKLNLAMCTEKQHLMFKRMYAHGNLEMDINEVVDSMPADKLEWAMQQLSNTLK